MSFLFNKNKLLFLLLLFSGLLILFLLRFNVKLKHELTRKQNQSGFFKGKIHNYELTINNLFQSSEMIGLEFPQINFVDIDKKKILTDFSSQNFTIILLFNPNACQACLNMQLKLLQAIHERVQNDEIQILAISNCDIGTLKRYRRTFGLTYTLISDSEGKIFESIYSKVLPVIYCINNHNEIIQSHIPIKNLQQFSLLFYTQLQNRLDLKNVLFNFPNASILDFINNKIDEKSISSFIY